MQSVIPILWAGSVLGAGGLLVYWSIALVRMVRTLRGLPTIDDGIGWARQHPSPRSLAVIVPAHNESDTIAQTIDTLRRQTHEKLGIVLVLDRCTDDTEAIAREAIAGDDRFELMTVNECPAGWSGKIHAIDHAVRTSEHARGCDSLLFVDADAELDPEIAAGALALAERRELDMLSLWSTLAVRSWFDWLVQPACGIELAYQFPLLRANRDERRRAFANGQFILFDRAAYERIGGHAAVNDEVFDDLALARRASGHGLRLGAFLSGHRLRVNMYPSWTTFCRGWKRIYTDAAKRKVSRLRRAVWRNLLAGVVLPACGVLAVVLGMTPSVAELGVLRWLGVSIALGGLLLWLGVLGELYRRGRFPLWAVPLHPLGVLINAGLLHAAGRDLTQGRPVKWGGREYHLEPR